MSKKKKKKKHTGACAEHVATGKEGAAERALRLIEKYMVLESSGPDCSTEEEMEVNDGHNVKAPLSMDVTAFGMLMEARDTHSQNALKPMHSIDSGISNNVRDEQYLNAFLPIDVTDPSKLTDVSDLHP